MTRTMTLVLVAMLAMACGGTAGQQEMAQTTAKQALVIGGQVYTLQQALPPDTLRAADMTPRLLMIGSDKPFSGVRITLSRPAPATYRGSLEVWYHATSKLSNLFGETNLLRTTDGTVNLSQTGSITWTAPSDWVPGYWLASSDPYCDETCKVVDPTLYWVGIALPGEPAPPNYNPCDIPGPVPPDCDPTLGIQWTPPPTPPVDVASIELL